MITLMAKDYSLYVWLVLMALGFGLQRGPPGKGVLYGERLPKWRNDNFEDKERQPWDEDPKND